FFRSLVARVFRLGSLRSPHRKTHLLWNLYPWYLSTYKNYCHEKLQKTQKVFTTKEKKEARRVLTTSLAKAHETPLRFADYTDFTDLISR
ncbi:MAG: hypothetical protein ABSB91_02520, partial [Sedimentisphaerales bacterium]